MLVLGLVGLNALWLDGWTLHGKPGRPEAPEVVSLPVTAFGGMPTWQRGRRT